MMGLLNPVGECRGTRNVLFFDKNHAVAFLVDIK